MFATGQDVLVGLRFVGSVCTAGCQPPAVNFDTHNDQEIARSLDQVRPTSLADLSGAVGQESERASLATA